MSWVISSGHPPHVHTPGLVWFCQLFQGHSKSRDTQSPAFCRISRSEHVRNTACVAKATHEQGQLLGNPTLKDTISSHHWP